MSIYIFSSKPFCVYSLQKKYLLNKNCAIKLTQDQKENALTVYDDFGKIEINLTNLTPSNYYNSWVINNDTYINILTTNYNSIMLKKTTPNFDVEVYNNSIRIFCDEKCFCNNFTFCKNTHIAQIDQDLYIFNEKNLIIFNKKNKSFNKLIVQKLAKNDKNIEILCKITEKMDYFLHFSLNLTDNLITIKKLKQKEILQSQSPQVTFFYLCKNNFDDAKKLLNDESLFANAHNYFLQFDDILQINDQYYLYNQSQFVNVLFIINDKNKITDID